MICGSGVSMKGLHRLSMMAKKVKKASGFWTADRLKLLVGLCFLVFVVALYLTKPAVHLTGTERRQYGRPHISDLNAGRKKNFRKGRPGGPQEYMRRFGDDNKRKGPFDLGNAAMKGKDPRGMFADMNNREQFDLRKEKQRRLDFGDSLKRNDKNKPFEKEPMKFGKDPFLSKKKGKGNGRRFDDPYLEEKGKGKGKGKKPKGKMNLEGLSRKEKDMLKEKDLGMRKKKPRGFSQKEPDMLKKKDFAMRRKQKGEHMDKGEWARPDNGRPFGDDRGIKGKKTYPKDGMKGMKNKPNSRSKMKQPPKKGPFRKHPTGDLGKKQKSHVDGLGDALRDADQRRRKPEMDGKMKGSGRRQPVKGGPLTKDKLPWDENNPPKGKKSLKNKLSKKANVLGKPKPDRRADGLRKAAPNKRVKKLPRAGQRDILQAGDLPDDDMYIYPHEHDDVAVEEPVKEDENPLGVSDPFDRILPFQFLIVGAPQSGVDDVFFALCKHPQVVCQAHDTGFFSSNALPATLDSYVTNFPAKDYKERTNCFEFGEDIECTKVDPSQPLITGEGSSYYMRTDPSKIEDALPKYTKVLFVTRDPAEQTFLEWQRQSFAGDEYRSFENTVTEEMKLLSDCTSGTNTLDVETCLEKYKGILSDSFVRPFVKNWSLAFGKERMKPTDISALEKEGGMKKVHEFLGIEPKQLRPTRIKRPENRPIFEEIREFHRSLRRLMRTPSSKVDFIGENQDGMIDA